jgi:hypothetical protein
MEFTAPKPDRVVGGPDGFGRGRSVAELRMCLMVLSVPVALDHDLRLPSTVVSNYCN